MIQRDGISIHGREALPISRVKTLGEGKSIRQSGESVNASST
jgi:hypothetical protein